MDANAVSQLLPLVLIALAFYFLVIRPQRKRAEAQRALLASIGAGDRVVTIGGFHGTVQSVDEDTLRLELAPGTVVTIARPAIARKVTDPVADLSDPDTGV